MTNEVIISKIKKIFAIGFVFCLGLASCSTGASLTPSTSSSLDAIMREAWLNQSGTGMFFGTGEDPNSIPYGTSGKVMSANLDPALVYQNKYGEGVLDVTGLNSQFPDNTPLWLKFITPGDNFGSSVVTFRVEKILHNGGGSFVTELAIEFDIPVSPQNSVVRLPVPAFSKGPGTYVVTAYTNGQQRFSRWVRYLAAGESPDPSFLGY